MCSVHTRTDESEFLTWMKPQRLPPRGLYLKCALLLLAAPSSTGQPPRMGACGGKTSVQPAQSSPFRKKYDVMENVEVRGA